MAISNRDIQIFKDYFTTGMNLQDLSKKYLISKDEVYNIAIKMFRYMKTRLRKGYETEWALHG